MYLAVAFAFLFIFSAETSSANEIVLKSGARGSLQVAVIEAPRRFGATGAGNMIDLTLTVTSKRKAKPEVDARSLCYLYGQPTYSRMQSDRAFLETAGLFLDMNAPLVGVRVSFFHSKPRPISIGQSWNFDMTGILKCKPLS